MTETELEQVFTDCSVLVSRKPRAHFAAKEVESTAEVLLKGKSMVQHEHILERSLACSALVALIKFTDLGAKADNHGADSRSFMPGIPRPTLPALRPQFA